MHITHANSAPHFAFTLPLFSHSPTKRSVWLTAAFSLFLPITLSNKFTLLNFALFCPDLNVTESVTVTLRDGKQNFTDTPSINIATRFADFPWQHTRSYFYWHCCHASPFWNKFHIIRFGRYNFNSRTFTKQKSLQRPLNLYKLLLFHYYGISLLLFCQYPFTKIYILHMTHTLCHLIFLCSLDVSWWHKYKKKDDNKIVPRKIVTHIKF